MEGLRYSSRGYKADPPALIHPNILIGSGEMLTPKFAKKHMITHVINCAYEEDSPSWFKTDYPDRYHCIEADDSVNANILDWYPLFKTVLKYFLRDPECGTVFVHCQCGINRSAFLALMYVCDVFHFPYKNTEFSLIRQRPCALTNQAYRTQVSEALSKKPK
jgi:hypothetical protein